MDTQDDPGDRLRSESIDAYLATLSAWDLLYIRSRFRNGTLQVQGLAQLTDLPPEVLSFLVPHLQLQDVLNCYLVCQSWREIWTQGAVSTALCRRFFPGLLELHGSTKPDRHAMFIEATKKYLRRHYARGAHGEFISWDVSWSSEVFANPAEPPIGVAQDMRRVNFGFSPLTVCYQDGKIAWQPGNCYLMVDDLRTRQRQRITFGIDFISGRPLQLQEVTDKLVILASNIPKYSSQPSMDSGQAIQVWHLDPMDSKRISLPGKFARCFAQGDSAVFVTKQGQVISWNWGGKAIELETDHDDFHQHPSGWSKELGGVPGVMFHPTNPKVIFVVWTYTPKPPDDRIYALVTVKYEDGKPTKRYETSLSHSNYRRDMVRQRICPAVRFTLSCQKMNSHGLYSVGIAQYILHRAGEVWPRSEEDKAAWVSVCFNTVTENFIEYQYKNRGRPHPPNIRNFDVRAWDDQLIITWFDEYLIVTQSYPYGIEWLEVESAEGEYGDRCVGSEEIALQHRAEVMDFMAGAGFARRVLADEDFLILTTGQGFLVYSWNSSSCGKIEGGAVRPSNLSKPKSGELLEPPRLPNLWDSRTAMSLKGIWEETEGN